MRPSLVPRSGHGSYYRFCIVAMLLLGTVGLLQSPLAERVHSATAKALQGTGDEGGTRQAGAGAKANGSASSRTVLIEFSVAGATTLLRRNPVAAHVCLCLKFPGHVMQVL